MATSDLASRLSAWAAAASAAIGVYVAIGNSVLQQKAAEQTIMLNEQKVRLDAADQLLRERADSRAEATTEREYIIRVYDKVSEALQTTDTRRQLVALALIETLPEARLRDRLSRSFALVPDLNPDVSAKAKGISEDAKVAVAIDQSLAAGWNYDIFWCTSRQENQVVAASILTGFGRLPASRVRVRQLPPQENAARFQAEGFQIRAEAGEMEQAYALKPLLEGITRQPVTVKTVQTPTKNYLSVFVCQ